jgi:hypothetical protein
LVLVLILLLSSFVLSATLLQRPAGQALDVQLAFDQAQGAADGALQQALANLDAGKPADAEVSTGPNVVGRAGGKPAGDVTEVVATGRAPAPRVDAGPAPVALVQVRATAARMKSGVWRIKSYVLVQSRLQTP